MPRHFYAKFRRIALLLCVFLLIGPTPLGRWTYPPIRYDQVVHAVDLNWSGMYQKTNVKKVGALTYEEGWAIDSDYTLFGGFSGIAMIGPRRFLLVGDTGLVTGFTLYPDGRVLRPFIKPLPDGPGTIDAKGSRDAESLTAAPDGSHYWVGFEQYHAIYRFGPSLDKAEAHSQPQAMRDWWSNGGVEGLARLSDGCFLAIAEEEEKTIANTGLRGVPALLFQGDPTEVPDHIMPFRYDAQGKGKVTDVQQLPDGRLIILHRDLSWREGFVSTIAIADLDGISTDDVMTSREIARIAPPAISDNFEGLAVVTEGNDWFIWMLSDDNLMGFQRSLLIKYKIDREMIAAPDGELIK